MIMIDPTNICVLIDNKVVSRQHDPILNRVLYDRFAPNFYLILMI